MKVATHTLAILSCTSAVASVAPGNYLRGGIEIDNDNENAICIPNNSTTTAAATTGTTPAPHTIIQVDNEICCQETGAYCQSDDVCLDHYFQGEHHIYCDVCSPASQCNTTATTTSSTVPNNTKRQVDGHECKEHTGADCINRDVCWDHYYNGKHYYYCEEPRENEPTTPPGPTCAHHNEECDPDRNESKQCCGALTCASVDGNVPERFRGAYGGIEHACLSVRENESGIEGDYYSSEA
mmetsp:Transcript_22369/g.36801  ORF Transcript_22369/g.36801 Transcript_22369/m.36801 type:complete len:239 (+) Transcript_22369:43-759(+)